MTLISLTLFSSSAQAAIIGGVTATSSFSTVAGSLANTVNGAGLADNVPSLTGTHATASASNVWVGSGSSGVVTFDFQSVYNLAGFSFWNWNADPMWGIRNLTITTSTDGTDFSALGGSPTSFAAGANTAPTPVQLFTVAPTAARYLRFNINDTYGAVGFAEAQFDGNPVGAVPVGAVPEPLTILGALTAAGFGAGFKRRLNKTKKD